MLPVLFLFFVVGIVSSQPLHSICLCYQQPAKSLDCIKDYVLHLSPPSILSSLARVNVETLSNIEDIRLPDMLVSAPFTIIPDGKIDMVVSIPLLQCDGVDPFISVVEGDARGMTSSLNGCDDSSAGCSCRFQLTSTSSNKFTLAAAIKRDACDTPVVRRLQDAGDTIPVGGDAGSMISVDTSQNAQQGDAGESGSQKFDIGIVTHAVLVVLSIIAFVGNGLFLVFVFWLSK